jgi:hypothetical protein
MNGRRRPIADEAERKTLLDRCVRFQIHKQETPKMLWICRSRPHRKAPYRRTYQGEFTAFLLPKPLPKPKLTHSAFHKLSLQTFNTRLLRQEHEVESHPSHTKAYYRSRNWMWLRSDNREVAFGLRLPATSDRVPTNLLWRSTLSISGTTIVFNRGRHVHKERLLQEYRRPGR